MAKKLVLLVAVVGLALPSIADAQCPVPGFQYAAFGDQGVDIVGNGTVRAYDSAAGTAPACGTDADLGTNSITGNALKVSGGSVVCGEVTVGATGTPGSVVQIGGGSTIAGGGSCTVTSCTAQATNTVLGAVTLPTGLTARPGALAGNQTLIPNSEYGDITTGNGETLTIPAGTYIVDHLNMAGGSILTVSSAPVVIFVKNQLDVGGTLTNPSLKATDLVFFGANTLTNITINSSGTQVSFGLYAPNADITLTGNSEFFGAMVGKSVRVAGNSILNYDRALSSFASNAITCANTEIARSTPIPAKVTNTLQEAIVQGTFNITAGSPTTILTTGDVTNWVFPHQSGHMRARLATSITTTASDFSAGTILFDAAVGIPQVVNAGCTLGSNSSFQAGCRNVFTNTNSDPGSGLTTTQIRRDPSSLVMLNDANADAIGALIAPTAAVSGIGSTHWQTIVRKVLRGSSTSTISRLGGVDRSSVAVIGPSTFAGVGTRPTMVYFGGTDGMLHAVCASTGGTTASQANICPTTLPDGTSPPAGQIPGTELWAFAPRVQLPLMRFNTARIDGSVRVTDVFGDFSSGTGNGTKTWHTILTFQTGYADTNGKAAVYALDITDPAKPILLWEYVAPVTGKTQFELGAGLVMAAGASLLSNVITNIAVAQTNNGGTGLNGFVATAIQLETGATKWKFGYEYPNSPGPRGVAADVNTLCNTATSPAPFTGMCTGVPGGAVGVDLIGTGFTSDLVMGDLYGNLWRLKASDGTSVLGPTTPIFTFTTNRHPIGSAPAILNNGNKVAVFGSGGYVDNDPLSTQWSTAQQHLVGVKLDGPTATSQVNEGSGSLLAFKADLTSGEKVLGQVLVVGETIFITSDTANFNTSGYGTGSPTGSLSSYNFMSATPSLSLVSAIQSGAGSATSGAAVFANGGGNTGTFVGGGTKQQAGATAAITGTKVDYSNTPKASRVAWLNTKF